MTGEHHFAGVELALELYDSGGIGVCSVVVISGRKPLEAVRDIALLAPDAWIASGPESRAPSIDRDRPALLQFPVRGRRFSSSNQWAGEQYCRRRNGK